MTRHLETNAQKLADLHERLALAADPGDEGQARRDKKGIPSARARIHSLLDPGSFLEIGALAKTPVTNALYGDGVVTGHGTISSRPVAVFSPTRRCSRAQSARCSAARWPS